MHVQVLIPILQFCSYSAPDWPTVKLLHDLQVVFSDPSVCFKTGNIVTLSLRKVSTNFSVSYLPKMLCKLFVKGFHRLLRQYLFDYLTVTPLFGFL